MTLTSGKPIGYHREWMIYRITMLDRDPIVVSEVSNTALLDLGPLDELFLPASTYTMHAQDPGLAA
ncbi:hypothetical protein [Bradyrhizobium sp. ARR65]|uniref:hypothetical protein n=1 Tax=Bradyrhizobium sp. ARR65 TaxID=1040989 RepID=UPI000A7AB445|nr:hypothetical protein [Bradyrhizobium sp. ARR65]